MEPAQSTPDAYYVMKDGDILGPYSREELKSGVAEKRFTRRDFAQLDGYPIWRPLARVLGDATDGLEGAVAPDWRTILLWAWRRFRYHLDEQSDAAGALFLAVGAVTLVLSNWPFLFWAPWFVIAAVAAVLLIGRQRTMPGLLLLLGVLGIPLCFALIRPHPVPARGVPTEGGATESASASRQEATPERPAPQPLPITPAPAAPVVVAKAPEVAAPTVAARDLASTPVELPKAPSLPDFPVPVGEGAPSQPAGPPSPAPAPPKGMTVAERVSGFFDRFVRGTPETPSTPVAGSSPTPTLPVSIPAGLPGTPSSSAVDDAANGIVQGHADAFAVVKGREGSGSSFICRQDGQMWLFTNIHVLADLQHPDFTRIDLGPLKLGAAGAAVGEDIMRFALTEAPPHPLEAITDFAGNVGIGDDVLVLGNSGGGGVVTSRAGKVMGIGPDRIEVSAEFIPGNSGSPVIHVKTGKVIGVATYLTRRYEQFGSNPSGSEPPAATPAPATPAPRPMQRSPWSTPAPRVAPAPAPSPGAGAMVVRRFAYRIDSVKTWQPVNWAVFRQEAEQMRQISLLTGDVFDFVRALRNHRAPDFATETLRAPANAWLAAIRGKHVSEADRERATESFLHALRGMVRNDVAAAEIRLRYSYFQEDLRSEREIRDELYKGFDAEAKQLASPTERGGF